MNSIKRKSQIQTFGCPVCGSTTGHAVVSIEYGNSSAGFFSIHACEYCGLGQIFPFPEKSELAQYYSNYYTEKGPSSNLKLLTMLKRALYKGTGFRPTAVRNLFHFLATHTMQAVLPAPFDTKKVLEIGCGYGRLLDMFQLQGWETYGVDPGIGASKFARKNGHKVFIGELQRGMFEKDFFSAIVFCHSLEHISDPVAVLKEAYRILSPGGFLLVEVPNAVCADASFFGEAWHAWHVPYHLYHWTPSALQSAVCNAGFVPNRFRFKIPKATDFKVNFKRLSRIRRVRLSAASYHFTVTWLLGHVGFNKEYYGHFVALYAHKPAQDFHNPAV